MSFKQLLFSSAAIIASVVAGCIAVSDTFAPNHLPSWLVPIPAYAIFKTCVANGSALAQAVSDIISLATSSFGFMARRHPLLSVCWNSLLLSRTRALCSDKVDAIIFEAGHP